MEQGQYILVIDDDEAILDFVREALSTHYTVWTLADPEAALHLLGKVYFDLAIVDLGMPGLSGDELIRHVRAGVNQELPVLVMSAFPELKKRTAGMDIQAILPKPFGLQDLERVVGQLLKKPAESRPQPELANA